MCLIDKIFDKSFSHNPSVGRLSLEAFFGRNQFSRKFNGVPNTRPIVRHRD